MGHLITLFSKTISVLTTQISDTFPGADSATSIGNAQTGQAWVPFQGTWGLRNNKAYSVSDVSGDAAGFDIGNKNTFTVAVDGVGQYSGNFRYPNILVFYSDASNQFNIRVLGTSVDIVRRQGGTATTVATTPFTATNDSTYRIEARVNGDTISAYVDGVFKTSYQMTSEFTTYKAFTKHGIRLHKAGTPTSNCDFDNFAIQY